MKISPSRRMKAFVAKWGGLILAAMLVLPIAVFGGSYLYANTRVDATLTWVTQEVTLNSLVAAGFLPGDTPDAPRRAVYHLSISVSNRTNDPAQVSISDVRTSLDEFIVDVVGSASWQGEVPGKESLIFEGDVVLSNDTYTELAKRASVQVEITGDITASTSYSFLEREATRPLKIPFAISLHQSETATPTTTP